MPVGLAWLLAIAVMLWILTLLGFNVHATC